MESSLALLFNLIVLMAFLFLLAVLYKDRAKVKKWLNTPYYAEDDRELRLKRRIEDAQVDMERDIEDAQVELESIAKTKSEKEAGDAGAPGDRED